MDQFFQGCTVGGTRQMDSRDTVWEELHEYIFSKEHKVFRLPHGYIFREADWECQQEDML